jgi:hypothetical protein
MVAQSAEIALLAIERIRFHHALGVVAMRSLFFKG